MVNKPLNEDVSGTNDRRSLTTSNPPPKVRETPSQKEQTLSCFGKGEMGTSEFFLINDPQNIFTSSGTTSKCVI